MSDVVRWKSIKSFINLKNNPEALWEPVLAHNSEFYNNVRVLTLQSKVTVVRYPKVQKTSLALLIMADVSRTVPLWKKQWCVSAGAVFNCLRTLGSVWT